MELSIGTFEVKRPTLRGWKLILGAMTKEEHEVIYDCLLILANTPDLTDEERQILLGDVEDGEAFSAASQKLAAIVSARNLAAHKALTILPRVPDVAAAVLLATLDPKLTAERVLDANEDDVVLVVQELWERGLFKDLVDRLGNAVRRTRKAGSSSSDAA